jgi:hypothetical protein
MMFGRSAAIIAAGVNKIVARSLFCTKLRFWVGVKLHQIEINEANLAKSA